MDSQEQPTKEEMKRQLKKAYDKQYRQLNQEKRKTNAKLYREKNRDKILEVHKQYYHDNFDRRTQKIECKCGKEYQLCGKARHFRSQYHIRRSNK
jgi:phosphoenolpyruvate-protein kinase (PTS system EI component)